MNALTWAIGDLTVHRVDELCEPVFPIELFIEGLPEDAVSRNLDWLAPDFIDPKTMNAIMSDHSWVIKTPHHNILIDSCWGNNKPRPDYGGDLNTPWLDRLAAHGLQPEDIDFVMCTHLHADHVGWNTRLIDGRWVPTFPNARYLFGRTDFDYWSTATNVQYGHDLAFQDSVLPCVEAGLADLVDGGYALGDTVIMEDAPGHTAGNMVIRARSNGKTGMFSGDVFHAPIQLAFPGSNSVACSLPDQARATRRALLDECAEHGHVLFPAHFPPPSCGKVSPHGEGFRFHPSAPLGS
jgi:glyoxylase-like metal-dependent hydrolase (beta-lactamase superfamily II)